MKKITLTKKLSKKFKRSLGACLGALCCASNISILHAENYTIDEEFELYREEAKKIINL